MHTRNIARTAFALIVLAVHAVPAHGQQAGERRPAIAATGGVTQYDLSGTGTEPFVGVKAQLPLLRHFTVEPGLTYMRYRWQGQTQVPRVHVWFPEVQLQAEAPMGALRPYIGVGGGAAIQSLASDRTLEATASVAGGARLDLGGGWGAGAELRVRAVDPFHGSTADWGLSLSRRL